VLTVLPNMISAAREGRAVVLRAVEFLVGERGIGQILDIGAGQPLSPNVHEVAQRIDPTARVVWSTTMRRPGPPSVSCGNGWRRAARDQRRRRDVLRRRGSRTRRHGS
jgi:hypothetical protein